MLTPPLAVALFTTILKRNGYEISLFDTTEYQENEDSSSANRVKNLQYRKYNHEKDIGDISKSQMLNDYIRNEIPANRKKTRPRINGITY